MRDKLNNFLLATLWLLISTLLACFWFNIRFGFNIFSSAHWHHLAYMQAAQNPVSPTFYISVVISVIVIIYGLYLTIRPRFKHIKLRHAPQITPPRTQQQPAPSTAPQPQPQPQKIAPAPVTPPVTAPTVATPEPTLARPPRLNIAVTPQLFSAQPPTSQPTQTTQSNNDWSEIREIFESTGYTVKGAPRISGTQTTVLAIGTDEVLWLGAVGVPTSALKSAIDTINQIFSDTLDDIIINVNGFVVSAPDADSPAAPDILTFDTPAGLRQYMSEHKNLPLGEDDVENFDAFSTYISTVIDYIGKM